MFDYHMHSTVSFDGHNTPEQMVQAALDAGLKEICFTDHIDHIPGSDEQAMIFRQEDYDKAYNGLRAQKLKIRFGMEFGLLPDNAAEFHKDLRRRDFDFVLGSVHFLDGEDVYFAPYWDGKTVAQAYRDYLEGTLRCVQAHNDFDVLAHLSYICKCRANPTHELLRYGEYRELIDEILLCLVQKGKGLEMNTSGVDRCGGFLPTADIFRRFKELGGEIVTVGSDAHTFDRVGQYTSDACRILGDIFGYVCTFQNRLPIFHKL